MLDINTIAFSIASLFFIIFLGILIKQKLNQKKNHVVISQSTLTELEALLEKRFKVYTEYFIKFHIEGKKEHLTQERYSQLKKDYVEGFFGLIYESTVYEYAIRSQFGSAESFAVYLGIEFDLLMLDYVSTLKFLKGE